jgi:hypothetical protein
MPHEFDTDTLDDIKQRDILNLETFLKKKGRQQRSFDKLEEANGFIGVRLAQMLLNLGVPLESCDQGLIDERLKSGNVKVEPRIYNTPDDEWRSGIYIYKDGEIAGFIGYSISDDFDVHSGYNVLCTEKI